MKSSRLVIAAALLAAAAAAYAEQMQRIGAYQAHYSLVPTTFLKPEVADGYDIVRARDRALLNVSVIDPKRGPVRCRVAGTVKDLLGNVRPLQFREVLEGEAVYYLVVVEHDDQEVLRFAVDIGTPDGAEHRLQFQQKLYWDHR